MFANFSPGSVLTFILRWMGTEEKDSSELPAFAEILKNDYENVKMEASLLSIVLALLGVVCWMRVNLRYNTLISILLCGMIIYFLLMMLLIFNYTIYQVSIEQPTMFLFYFSSRSSCVIMLMCIALYVLHIFTEAYKFIYECNSIPKESKMKWTERLRDRIVNLFKGKRKKPVPGAAIGRFFEWVSSWVDSVDKKERPDLGGSEPPKNHTDKEKNRCEKKIK